MRIQRFRANSMPEAMELVKAELGDEAVILQTRKVQERNPLTGAIVTKVEIAAAIEMPEPFQPAMPEIHTPEPTTSYAQHHKFHSNDDSLDYFMQREDVVDRAEAILSHLKKDTAKPDVNKNSTPPYTSYTTGTGKGTGTSSQQGTLYQKQKNNKFGKNNIQPSPIDVLKEVFDSTGIKGVLQQKITLELLSGLEPGEVVSKEAIYDAIKGIMCRQIKIGRQPDARERTGGPVCLAMIGPTGVGKTTTLAKIAARLRLQKKMNGVLVSSDTYRLGATDQLRRYAQLIGLEIELVRDVSLMPAILAKHQGADFILVDTTGRSPRDPRHLEELRTLFGKTPNLSGYAFLPATSKTEDIGGFINFYSQFPVSGWVVTKVDETFACSTLLGPVLENRLAISYLTDGQRVPEDLVAASHVSFERIFFNDSL